MNKFLLGKLDSIKAELPLINELILDLEND
jgi:hypothetical protein